MVKRVRHHEIVQYLNTCLELETDDCIEWKYAKHKGYGVIRIDAKNYVVSRLALIKHSGNPPSDKHYALHLPTKCHNPSCFNYRHLRWGTQKENINDRNIDMTHNKGERNGMSRLSQQIVDLIRQDNGKQRDLAKRFSISPATVSMIKSGKRWL